MILNVAYDAALARVQLTADVIVGRKTVKVERSLNELLWETVRGGAAVPVVGDSVAVDDYEFVSDVVNFYRVTPADFVAGFEANTAGWEPVGGTLARSTAQAFDGAGSALLTPDGVTATVRARTTLADSPPAVPDVEHELSVWVWSVNGRDIDISVAYVDAANVNLDFTIWQTVTVPAATWTRIAGKRVAPANTAKAQINVNDRDTPAAGDLLHIDQVEFTPADYSSEAQTASLTPSLGGQIWLKSIRWPFLNRAVVVTDFSDVARAARGGVFDVAGRAVPVSVSDVRGSQQFELVVKTETAVEQRDMDLIMAAGSEFFVHLPTDCAVPGGYVVIADTAEARRLRSARSDRRYRTLPCTVVAAPGPEVTGGTMTWGAVLALYGSWQQLIASNPRWVDLLVDVASPEDLVAL